MMNPYQNQGPDGVPMLGRRTVMRQLHGALERDSPLHISLIGPTQIGKSVVLRALATRMRDDSKKFEAVVYWNLGHGTPANDEEFFHQLHDRIKAEPFSRDLKEWFDSSRPREALSDFFDDVSSQEKTFLLILDSLDSPLAKGSLSANTLDWMRSLSDAGTAVFVTGSRATLHELCRSEETQTSPFWNIFDDPPKELGPWDTAEWDEILAPLRDSGKTVHPAAEAAIQEWTNGIPALTTLVLSHLFELPQGTEIHAKDVNRLCEEIADSEAQILKQLWSDCHPDWQGALVELASHNLPSNALPAETLKGLKKRGFVRKSGGEVVASAKFLTVVASRSGAHVEHLTRLFSEHSDYRSNICSVLIKRLSQISNPDPKLSGFILHTIRGVELEPHTALSGIRGIADRAMTMIFASECPNDSLEKSWVYGWQRANHRLANHEDVKNYRVPRKGSPRRDLIMLMAGELGNDRVSKRITRPTALLVNFLQRTGDFGQHLDDNEVTFEFAVTVCAAAIELCDHLARELDIMT